MTTFIIEDKKITATLFYEQEQNNSTRIKSYKMKMRCKSLSKRQPLSIEHRTVNANANANEKNQKMIYCPKKLFRYGVDDRL